MNSPRASPWTVGSTMKTPAICSLSTTLGTGGQYAVMGALGADMTTVGVSIPFYAGLDYLRQALESLIGQSDPDWTAVVIDDRSPEPGAAELVAGLGDQRIRFVRNHTNLGLAGNFNRCLAAPATDVVAIFHADDVLEPDYVATIRAAHQAFPDAAMVAPMATAVDADGAPIDTGVDKLKRRYWPVEQRSLLRGDDGLARLMNAFFVYCPAMSYRPALLPEPPFDARFKQVMDLDLFARVLLDGGAIVLDRTRVYRYRRHTGTVTSQNARAFTRLAEETDLADEVAAAAKAQGWHRTARAARWHWTQRLNGVVALGGSVGRHAPGRLGAVRDVLS
jgi:glycosyltransferase involved in cell wall biosynthesis